MSSKAELRKQILSKSQPVTEWSNPELLDFLKKKSGVWSGYHQLKAELPPDQMIQKMSHLTWVYPVLEGPELMVFQTPDGVMVPKQKIDGLLIPGLAFDREGFRLGRGKGYFDRFLKGYSGIKIGVTLQSQIMDRLPRETWDQKVDLIATESRLIDLRS